AVEEPAAIVYAPRARDLVAGDGRIVGRPAAPAIVYAPRARDLVAADGRPVISAPTAAELASRREPARRLPLLVRPRPSLRDPPRLPARRHPRPRRRLARGRHSHRCAAAGGARSAPTSPTRSVRRARRRPATSPSSASPGASP